jgi:hypothetical protein
MPVTSYLAIRKMIKKLCSRLALWSHHFEAGIMVALTALFVWLCIHHSQ